MCSGVQRPPAIWSRNWSRIEPLAGSSSHTGCNKHPLHRGQRTWNVPPVGQQGSLRSRGRSRMLCRSGQKRGHPRPPKRPGAADRFPPGDPGPVGPGPPEEWRPGLRPRAYRKGYSAHPRARGRLHRPCSMISFLAVLKRSGRSPARPSTPYPSSSSTCFLNSLEGLNTGTKLAGTATG